MLEELFEKTASECNKNLLTKIIAKEVEKYVLERTINEMAAQVIWSTQYVVEGTVVRLAELRQKESNEIVENFVKMRLVFMSSNKLLKLTQFVEQQVLKIAARALLLFNEEAEMFRFVEHELTDILTEDTLKSIKDNSKLWKDFIEEELFEWTNDKYAHLNDDELYDLVSSKYEMKTYLDIIEIDIYLEASMRLVSDEFIKLYREEKSRLFEEMVDLLSIKLYEVAGKKSI